MDNKKFKKTIQELLKKYYVPRDKKVSNGKEKIITTYNSLTKHNYSLNENDTSWGWVPKSIFNADLNSETIGLFGLLVMDAGITPFSGAKRVIINLSAKDLSNSLGVNHQNLYTRLEKMLQELSDNGFLIENGKYTIINTETLSEAQNNGGYIKLYTYAMNDILKKSHGLIALKRIATYMALKSEIYEGKNDKKHIIFKKYQIKYANPRVKQSETVFKRNLDWFIKNGILAWNLVITMNQYHNKQYYVAEKIHGYDLAMDIASELNENKLLRVVE